MSDEPAKDTSAPSGPTKRALRIRNVTDLPTHAATGKHRVINSCRGGHEEVIEVHTRGELTAAMTAACRVCGGLVNVSRHVNGTGIELRMILIPDPR